MSISGSWQFSHQINVLFPILEKARAGCTQLALTKKPQYPKIRLFWLSNASTPTNVVW